MPVRPSSPLAPCAVALLVLALACEKAPPPFGAVDDVRDSAGVQIVVSTAPSWPSDSVWHLATDTPLVDIGGTAASPFQEIVGIAVTASGVIVVADGATQRIRLYDAHGGLLRQLGGRGTDAGEFQALSWIGAAGDSIIAYDLVQRRLTLFPTRGRVRTATLDAGGTQYIAPLEVFHDGTLLVVSGGAVFPFPAPTGQVRRDSAQLMRVTVEGVVEDTIAQVAWGESFGVRLGRGTGAFIAPMPRPFSRRASAAVWGDKLLVGDGDGYAIEGYNSVGRLVSSYRRPLDPEPVTPEAIDGFRAARARAPASTGVQRELDSALVAALDSAPFPAVMPSFERILADPSGNIWVEAYSVRGDQPTSWSIFDSDGRWLGDVRTPDRFEMRVVTRDAVYGVWRDPGEAPRLRAYRVWKGG